MIHYLKRLLASPVFLVSLAFALRMMSLASDWNGSLTPVRAFIPYGFELGRVASSIAAGHGFSSPLRMLETGPTAWFTPIYPYLVAGIFRVWGIFSNESRLIIQTLNCAFAALIIIPIYGISSRIFAKGTAVGAAWGWVFLPTAFKFPISWIWDSTMAALFLTLIFWATLAVREAKTILPWAGYGALWVTGVLINPSLLSLFPFLAAWAVWQSRPDFSSRFKIAAAALLVFTAGLAPWTVRNYRVLGKFIVLRSNFGLELWLGNNPQVTDTWTPWRHPNDDPEEGQKYKQMGEIAYMADKEHEALTFMRTHPADTTRFVFRRFVGTWLATTDSAVDAWASSSIYFKISLIQNFSLSVMALFGTLFAYRVRPKEAIPFALALLVFPLVFYLTHTSLRYRFPIDPLLIILAVQGIAYPISVLRARFQLQPGQAAPVPPVPTL